MTGDELFQKKQPKFVPTSTPACYGKMLMRKCRILPSIEQWRPYMIIAFAYLIITVFFTYPLILSPAGSYIEFPYVGSNDQYVHMWDVWWVKKALLDLHLSVMKTPYLYYPQGADLSLHELTIVNGVITFPFQLLLPNPYGVVLAHNVALILSFVLAGVGAYALFYYLTRNAIASFVGGLAFAFAPYRTTHIIHLALLSTGWLPLYLLFLLKVIRQPSRLNACLAAMFVLLTLYSCQLYIYFIFLLTVVVVAYHAFFEWKQFFKKSVLLPLALLGLLSAIVVLPQVLLAAQGESAQEQSSEIVNLFSADAAGYLIPTWKHVLYRPLLRALPAPTFSITTGDETFLGYVLAAFALIGILKTRPRVWGPWALIAVSFFMLSLGPSLDIYGHHYNIAMPYALLNKYLPFFNVMRTPCRFVVFVTLACAALASYGLSSLMDGMGKLTDQPENRENEHSNPRSIIFATIVALLLMLELWNIPFASKKIVVPDIYFEIAKEQGDFGVLDLPLTKYRDIATYMFYQTVHGKPIATGLLARSGEKEKRWLYILRSPRFSKPETMTKQDVYLLKQAGFRYIIHHSIDDGSDSITGIMKLW